MYFNKFSTGTILALLALSGMLFLVPLAAPVHAANATSPTLSFVWYPVPGGATESDEFVTITNPASNQYAITGLVLTVPATPTGWVMNGCALGAYFKSEVTSATSCSWTAGATGAAIPPGSADTIELAFTTPASGSNVYPYSSTFTSTVQDASSNAYYAGSTLSVQVLDPSSTVGIAVTPGGSNTAAAYTAGTAPYTDTATLTCIASANCPGGLESGVTISWTVSGYAAGATYSVTPASGTTASNGKTSTTFQPSNSVNYGAGTVNAQLASQFSNTYGLSGYFGFNYIASAAAVTTSPSSPHSVSFYQGAGQTAFPANYYTGVAYTTGNTLSGGGMFKGAGVADAGASEVWVAVSDAFGNPEQFDSASLPNAGLSIKLQAASGAYFDAQSPLLSTFTAANPGAPSNFALVNSNYVQSGAYGTVGIITATITGTFNGNAFSVSGSSGNIVTTVYVGTTWAFQTTAHAAFASANAKAGSTYTIDFAVIPPATYVAQSAVPVTIGVCPNHLCGGTTSGYSGTFSGASWVKVTSNSTGIVSGTLTVDTNLGHAVAFNATVSDPINGTPTNTVTCNTNAAGPCVGAQALVTTVAGSATKFQVSVGVTQSETPSPISYAYPGETVYVNVITTDNYGNIVTNNQAQQIQINLVASPATLTATSVYIPQGCAMTNETNAGGNPHGYNCTGALNSFGAVAWTLPSTLGPATISASGVLNGVATTSATTTINVVSKTPSLSVTSPVPTNGYLYTNGVNVQFQGWANVSKGYNGLAHMSTLGLKIGSASWTQNTITAVANSQWSVVATLPANAVTAVNFNATDSKGNTVVFGTPYNVLVDLTTPTITFVTSNGATVNGTNPLTATIVATEGDLNTATSGTNPVTVTYNGTALASSAIQVTGTNNPGSKVTYTVTATLPVGKWNVVVSATTLAGNTGTSSTIQVTEVVQTTGSFSLVGSPSQVTFANNPDTITGVYKNNLAASETITVLGIVSTTSGAQVGYATGTVTIAAGASGTFYLSFVGLTPGTHYNVTFYVLSSTGVVSSVKSTTTMTA